jgi:hypothetical protein
MGICDYGCGQEAKYKMTSEKLCCSDFYTKCPEIKRRNIETNRIKQKGEANGFYGKHHSEKTKELLRNKRIGKSFHTKKWKLELSKKMLGENNPFYGKTHSLKTVKIISEAQKYTIKKIQKKYPIFSKIEKMRYNPDKPGEKEIQFHCKNHLCSNSKEHNGWFTPTKTQLYERIRQIEFGNGGCYLYCSNECKQTCPLYNLSSDPYKESKRQYTDTEYQIFRHYVLERDGYECQYCGKQAEHVHHERPQKLEPFFALDPDLAWSVCKECHYKYSHKDECSSGNLAKVMCSEEK